MKALTIRQPWATWVIEGRKTIETRSRPCSYRGPVAVHAGKQWGIPELRRWFDGSRDDEPPIFWDLFGCNADQIKGVEMQHDSTGDWWRADFGGPRWPSGAVVGSVDLIDCLPIVAPAPISQYPETPDRVVQAGNGLCILSRSGKRDDWWGEVEAQVDDQLPLGDFSHGRWAWIFANPRKCEPVPAKGKLGLWNWDGEA